MTLLIILFAAGGHYWILFRRCGNGSESTFDCQDAITMHRANIGVLCRQSRSGGGKKNKHERRGAFHAMSLEAAGIFKTNEWEAG